MCIYIHMYRQGVSLLEVFNIGFLKEIKGFSMKNIPYA